MYLRIKQNYLSKKEIDTLFCFDFLARLGSNVWFKQILCSNGHHMSMIPLSNLSRFDLKKNDLVL